MQKPEDATTAGPLALSLHAGLGPVGWRYVPSEVWGDAILTQDPKTAQLARDMGREVEPLYTEAQMLARLAAEREKLNMLRAFVADDSIACTYQSLGQYRAALLRALRA